MTRKIKVGISDPAHQQFLTELAQKLGTESLDTALSFLLCEYIKGASCAPSKVTLSSTPQDAQLENVVRF
jgi:hypothetical protein